MSRRKKQQETAVEAAPSAAIESASNDTTQETPKETLLEAADARIISADEGLKPERFYCFATDCPGYEYRADVRAHPTSTCGSIVNCVHLHKTNPPPAVETTPSIDETKAPISETIPACAGVDLEEIDPPPVTTPGLEPPEPPPETPPERPQPVPDPAPFPVIMPDMPGLEEPDDGAQNPPTAEGLLVPEIGSLWEYWTAGWLQLVEVLGISGVETVDPMTQVGVMLYSTALPAIQGSKSGNASGAFFNLEDFNNGRLLSWENPVPGWIVNELSSAAKALLTLDQIEDCDFGAVFPDTPAVEEPLDGAIDPPAAPGTPGEISDREIAESFGARIEALAVEMGVRPTNVCRTIEAALDLSLQVTVFQSELRTSPLVAALRARVLEESSKSSGLVAAILSVLGPTMSRLFERTALEYWVQRSTDLDKWTAEVEAKIAGFYGEIRQMREQIDDVSKHGKQDASAAALKATEAELKKAAEQVDGALDRLFALESWQKKIQHEIGDFARSRKLQKHDPKSAAERGREFREREAKLKVEKEKNLAKLRDEKKKLEAIERGARRAGRLSPKPAQQPPKRGRGRPRKNPAPASDMAARKAVSAPAKRGRGRPPKVPPQAPKRGRGRPPKVAKKVPAPTSGHFSPVVASFMGKHKDEAVRKLLEKISPYKWQDFAKQCKSGLPDMTALKWGPAQMSTFAKWYYGRQLGTK